MRNAAGKLQVRDLSGLGCIRIQNTKYYVMELFLFFLWIVFMGALGIKLYLAHQALKRDKKEPTP
jgi:hypothetical protein